MNEFYCIIESLSYETYEGSNLVNATTLKVVAALDRFKAN